MTANNSTLTHARLKELLHYDPDSGIFTWLVDRKNNMIGVVAGSINSRGYILISINGEKHTLHKLAFLYMDGEYPPDQVDHRNRIKTDNRWCNLRHYTNRLNCANKDNNNIFVGVDWVKKSNRWRARSSQRDGVSVSLGHFKTHFAACYCRHADDMRYCNE